MSTWANDLADIAAIDARVAKLKARLRQRYTNSCYLIVHVRSATFGLGLLSPSDQDGYMAACADYERKFGRVAEPALFRGYRIA